MELDSERSGVFFEFFIGLIFDNYLQESAWTQVKEIANTKLLVSVHCSEASANLEVFDASWKGQAKKIYSFEEVSGGRINFEILMIIFVLETGKGDMSSNPRRSILGAVPIEGKIAYHLYNFTTRKTGNSVQLIRKSKWHSKYSNKVLSHCILILSNRI